ncbi:MAG: hypothetical protein KJ558_15190 [Gammaproteobacteria bacterium]|nr:hypothetical protein [Gammaproteobacteria bacterium]MBU1656132.1 hypothetical protein [Gammaproteobacteria bacterium]MBU1960378.1 hypothetical protein [Gammaproteobacteria bacterium]
MELELKEATHRQRTEIAKLLHEPLAWLAQECVPAWGDRGRLNEALIAGFSRIPHCTSLFVVNWAGIQVCDNVNAEAVVEGHFGRDRSSRPYMNEAVPEWGFLLSDAYVGLASQHPSLTALHAIHADGELLGYLGANFDLRNLPITGQLYQEPDHWRQIKGDPSIRQLLFQQCRVDSLMDQSIAQALSILEELCTERGVFQVVIHFSSSRATVWTIDDPFRYHILDHEALADPDICLAYPCHAYPADALIPAAEIMPILETMRELRFSDETVYLRSASINLFNGMISLTFSCDGSHYMRHDEFLTKNLSFWYGNL